MVVTLNLARLFVLLDGKQFRARGQVFQKLHRSCEAIARCIHAGKNGLQENGDYLLAYGLKKLSDLDYGGRIWQTWNNRSSRWRVVRIHLASSASAFLGILDCFLGGGVIVVSIVIALRLITTSVSSPATVITS